MAHFIAISGPSSTGKTTLMKYMELNKKLSRCKFSPDLYNQVWSDLVEKKLFSEYGEIIHDSEYLCVYILKLIEYYENYIRQNKDYKGIIFLDCCWLDLCIYSIINLWYTHTVKDIQVDIIAKLNKLSESVDKIYVTKYDEEKEDKTPYRVPYKVYSVKGNRPLELQYYSLARHMTNVDMLPTSDLKEEIDYIISDLDKLGYL